MIPSSNAGIFSSTAGNGSINRKKTSASSTAAALVLLKNSKQRQERFQKQQLQNTKPGQGKRACCATNFSRIRTCFVICFVAIFVLYLSAHLLGGYSYSSEMLFLANTLRQAQLQTQNQQSPQEKKELERILHDYMMLNGVEEPLYIPAPIEHELIKQAESLGYNTTGKKLAEGCKIWLDSHDSVHPEMFESLQQYRQELKGYEGAVKARLEALKKKKKATKDSGTSARQDEPLDVRKLLTEEDDKDYDLCQQLEVDSISNVHSVGKPKPKSRIRDLQSTHFPSGQLSRTLKGGWMEPLLPPMRHVDFCFQKKGNYLNLGYLIHDFAHMCRHLKPSSKIVMLDLTSARERFTTSLKIVQRFQEFGLRVDHIHAFIVGSGDDLTGKSSLGARQLQGAASLGVSYHWENPTGRISVEPGHSANPWTLIQSTYNEHDLVLVKMDLDLPEIELALAHQLLKTPSLWKLVDQFYFEHVSRFTVSALLQIIRAVESHSLAALSYEISSTCTWRKWPRKPGK